ncbi:MAG: dihydroneopterin aldolase [Alphaproteobacteria bacterium]|nr:dihydroneopterin aldolase [Alphaproteobacteria bacterium]
MSDGSDRSDGVLVTGASARLAGSFLESLARGGCRLVLHGHRRVAALEAERARLLSLGAESVTVLSADFAHFSEADAAALIARAEEAVGGRLSLFLNLASLFLPDSRAGDSVAVHSAVNYEAPVFLVKALAESAKTATVTETAADSDVLAVLLCDGESAVARGGGLGGYALAAERLYGGISGLACEAAPMVRVNGLALGPAARGERQSEAHFMSLVRRRLLARVVGGGEMVAALEFLRTARSVTGEVLHLDGGARAERAARSGDGGGYEILIERLALSCRVGWLEGERERMQELWFSVRGVVDGDPGGGDDLGGVVDYGSAVRLLRGAVEGTRARLLETLGEEILSLLMSEFPRLSRVELRIEKPAIYGDAEAVGILLRRRRQ